MMMMMMMMMMAQQELLKSVQALMQQRVAGKTDSDGESDVEDEKKRLGRGFKFIARGRHRFREAPRKIVQEYLDRV